jgi:hypothetical protein
MQTHMQINDNKANKVQINNVKTDRKLGVVSDEDFKTKVKKNLNLY